MDKQGRQEHEGSVQNVPRWLSLSQAFLPLNSKQKPLVLTFRVGELYSEPRMTSPRLARHISGQEVIYKLLSLYSDGAIKMIHEHLQLIFGVFLLFRHEEECRVRSINLWQ